MLNILQDNPLKIKGKPVTLKSKVLKKKNDTISASTLFTYSAKGQKVLFVKASGNKAFTINKSTGKVTVKKGLKKGTYKVRIKVMATGNDTYKASDWKTVTVKIRVK